MGKERKQRKTYHLQRSDNKPFNETEWDGITHAFEEVEGFLPVEVPENLFSEIAINIGDLNANLDPDTGSVISTSKRSCKSVTLSKKERRQLRHNTFISKIQSFQERKEEKKKKKNKKEEIATLPEELFQLQNISSLKVSVESSKKKSLLKIPKKKGILKAKDRTKKMLKDAKELQDIWASAHFQADPLAAVSDLGQEYLIKELMQKTS